MKKRIFIFLAIVAIVVCVFAVSASADSVNPSTSNEFGTLTTFDGDIGRTDISWDKEDGSVARTVLFDGTNYYTVPTGYLLTKNNYESGGILLQFDFNAINSKMTGKSFSKTSVIRCELPAAITLIAGEPQNFNGFSNAVEIKLSPSLSFVGNTTYKAFANCTSLVEIDLSNVNFNFSNSTYSLLEYCKSLEKVILPDAYEKDGVPVDYAINFMFNGCNKLESVENYRDFFKGVTVVGYKAFMDCNELHNIELWDGITAIEGRAFQSCSSMTEFIIPSTCTTIGTTETVFASCTSLKKIVFPAGAVSVGSYAFEKCSALTDVWMPGAGSTFAVQVFGQCGSGLNVNFYFTTETNSVTVTDTSYNNDPYLSAINNANGDPRLKFSTPLSTKCTVFLGGHEKPTTVNSCTSGGNCVVCSTLLEGVASSHNLVTTVTFEGGFAQAGVKKITCQNWEKCTIENVSEDLAPIFEAKGYSYKEGQTKSGLSGGFKVNPDSLKEYKDHNPDADMAVTLIIVNPDYLDENGFFGENGISTASKGVVQVDISALTYENYEYIISGFNLDLMQSLELAFAMVVSDGEYLEVIQKQYGEGETSVAKATYTDKNDNVLYSVTVESIAPDMVAELAGKEQES